MSFEWDDQPTPLLRFDAPPGFSVAFSGRRGGVSEGPFRSLNLGFRTADDPRCVAENRRRALAAAGGDPARAATCRQVHGAEVATVDAPPAGALLDPGFASPCADALATRTPGVTLMVQGADCLCVALCGPDGSLAVAHAGWGGLLAGVLERAVAAAGASPVCAVGPGAGPCCYAVRDDVGLPLRRRFGDDVVHDGRADLWSCAERALLAAGAARVELARRCTICDDEAWFSHRRDGPCGRQAVLARLEQAA